MSTELSPLTARPSPGGGVFRRLAAFWPGRLSPEAALDRALALQARSRAEAALPLFTRAAKAGLAEAAYWLGRCYLEGAGVPANGAEGARWLRRAAEAGHVAAQSLLAALCLHGVTGPAGVAETGAAERLFAAPGPAEPDFAAAASWARSAAEAGSAEAQALLGYILSNGPEGLRDLEAAERWYRRAAEAGNPQGHLGYAMMLAPRAADEPSRRAVAEHLGQAAAAELPSAIYLLGALTEQGIGIARDPDLAFKLYREAARRGQRTAQLRIGAALVEGVLGDRAVAPDPVEGESWLRRAALAGDAEAAARVGDLYAKSEPLPPNYAEAASWYRRAAEAGHRRAARALASLHLTGEGVARDMAEAMRWLRASAAQDGRAETGAPRPLELAQLVPDAAGGASGQARLARWFEEAGAEGDLVGAFNFGLCLARGFGVDRDEVQAAEWLRRAAEGLPDAQYAYGRMLAEGRGMPADPVGARAWLERAAEAGLAEAQAAFAEMLVNGRGGPPDAERARQLFEAAAAAGHIGAMFALGALHAGGHGLPADRSEAQSWWRAAAEHGHGYGQLMLARCLAAGAAGPRDPARARLWLERAAAQGVPEAETDLAALAMAAADAAAA